MKQPSRMIDLWWISLSGEVSPSALAILTATERERAARYRREDDARRFVAGRLGLRHALAHYLPRDGRAGAVTLIDRDGAAPLALHGSDPLPLAFSFSRAGDAAVAVITTTGRVGVDLERTRPLDDVEGLAALTLAPAEQAWLQALPTEGRQGGFLRLWTLKEALVKATGEGLSAPLPYISIDPGPPPILLQGPSPYVPCAFWLAEIPVAGFFLALAGDGAMPGWQWCAAPAA